MYNGEKFLVAKNDSEEICLIPSMANRHGLIAGATGTGKTVSLKVMAESFSDLGVPVFLADIKGDLSGFAFAGAENKHVDERVQSMQLTDFVKKAYPTAYWDVFGEKGVPVRTTASEMGPLLLSRILGLNDTQSGILNIAFRVADDRELLLIDLKDLKAMLKYVSDNAADLTVDYGNISKQSVGAIVRAIVALETEGGETFLAEPSLDIRDWMRTDASGRGVVNVLDCQKLSQTPKLYGTFLLWLLSELYEIMPEVGDLDKPRMVFFFDEAHMLFDNASDNLMDKIEQVVRLIRSKGIGIYFITQNPSDIPDTVLSQLGNRIQHALRAYTPADMKSVKTAAESFRPNPDFDTLEAITQLATGEALVSFLDEKGSPSIVHRAFILPPQSFMGGIDDSERQRMIVSSEFELKYRNSVDRDSAYEGLVKEAEEAKEAEEKAKQEAELKKQQAELEKQRAAEEEKKQRAEEKAKEQKAKEERKKKERTEVRRERRRDKVQSQILREVTKEATSALKKNSGSILRGILGTLLKK